MVLFFIQDSWSIYPKKHKLVRSSTTLSHSLEAVMPQTQWDSLFRTGFRTSLRYDQNGAGSQANMARHLPSCWVQSQWHASCSCRFSAMSNCPLTAGWTESSRVCDAESARAIHAHASVLHRGNSFAFCLVETFLSWRFSLGYYILNLCPTFKIFKNTTCSFCSHFPPLLEYRQRKKNADFCGYFF